MMCYRIISVLLLVLFLFSMCIGNDSATKDKDAGIKKDTKLGYYLSVDRNGKTFHP